MIPLTYSTACRPSTSPFPSSLQSPCFQTHCSTETACWTGSLRWYRLMSEVPSHHRIKRDQSFYSTVQKYDSSKQCNHYVFQLISSTKLFSRANSELIFKLILPLYWIQLSLVLSSSALPSSTYITISIRHSMHYFLCITIGKQLKGTNLTEPIWVLLFCHCKRGAKTCYHSCCSNST